MYAFSGIKFALSFLSTSPFRSIKAHLYDKPYSPCIQHRIKSDAYWECVLRHQAVGNGQATSTCLMGSPDNPESVVDTLLRYVITLYIIHVCFIVYIKVSLPTLNLRNGVDEMLKHHA